MRLRTISKKNKWKDNTFNIVNYFMHVRVYNTIILHFLKEETFTKVKWLVMGHSTPKYTAENVRLVHVPHSPLHTALCHMIELFSFLFCSSKVPRSVLFKCCSVCNTVPILSTPVLNAQPLLFLQISVQ